MLIGLSCIVLKLVAICCSVTGQMVLACQVTRFPPDMRYIYMYVYIYLIYIYIYNLVQRACHGPWIVYHTELAALAK